MSIRVNTDLLADLKKYGAGEINACFNCGNCTAICPLTEDSSFPRRMIRMAQIGMRDELLASKELWMCYYCGECTETCPRQAEPGEFMAAARRYAIGSYDPTGLAKLLFRSNTFAVLFLLVLAVLIALFMMSMGNPAAAGGEAAFGTLSMPSTPALFEFIPYEFIHTAGIVSGLLVVFAIFAGIWRMFKAQESYSLAFQSRSWKSRLAALWNAGVVEVLGQKRYRDDCEPDRPFYSQKWFIHASIMWGFMGLLVATALDFLLDIVGLKPTGTPVPLWNPIRLLGTFAGILLVYGTTVSIFRRVRKTDASTRISTTADWAFLILMWLSGITGFFIEIAIYLPQLPVWGYWIFLLHLVAAGEMLILLPFTKFAHAIYRSMALYFHALEQAPEEVHEPSPSTA